MNFLAVSTRKWSTRGDKDDPKDSIVREKTQNDEWVSDSSTMPGCQSPCGSFRWHLGMLIATLCPSWRENEEKG